jgi:hypothetical protein
MRQEALDKVREIRHAYRHGFPTIEVYPTVKTKISIA